MTAPPTFAATAPVFAAALFDLDGVLIDTHEAIEALWQRLARARRAPLTPEDVRTHVQGCAPEHTVAALFEALDGPAREHVLQEVRAAEPHLGFRALDGAVELVMALSAARVPIALVTGASATRANRVLTELGLDGCFQARVVWGDTERGKPAPDVYALAAARLGLPPSECVVFEDAPNGVLAAVAAGALCLGIAADQPDALVAAGARWIVPDLAGARPTTRPGLIDIQFRDSVILSFRADLAR